MRSASDTTAHAPGFGLARTLYWLAFFVFLTAVTVGLGWDRRWHTTHRFESIFSPPHLFIYATSVLATLIVVVLLGSSRLRRWFAVSTGGPAFFSPPYASGPSWRCSPDCSRPSGSTVS